MGKAGSPAFSFSWSGLRSIDGADELATARKRKPAL